MTEKLALAHETLVFERRSATSPERLFAAYRSAEEREAWSAPSPTAAVRIDESDFRTGGTERTRCGSDDDLRWRTEVTYHLVQEPSKIVFTEALFEGDALLTIALVSFELRSSEDGGTELRVTDQVTSLVGPDAIAGHRQGYDASLAAFCAIV